MRSVQSKSWWQRRELLGALGLGVAAIGAAACGPKRLQVNPADVSALQVRPASGQDLFCPGDPFLVEVLATMKDGSSCSSRNPELNCLGSNGGVIIDPATVHLEGSNGSPAGELIWRAVDDPLATAATGLTLKSWLVASAVGQAAQSVVAERLLKPVYQCQTGWAHYPPAAPPVTPGGAGPEVRVAVTTLSTPFYPAGALIRVEMGTARAYYVSPSFDSAFRITVRGQDGGPGMPGAPGIDGKAGQSAQPDQVCAKGERGTDGSPGNPGSPGANGGSGGTIYVVLDAAAADKLRGRILTEAPGGNGGPGGPGGAGGRGGPGGSGGKSGPGCENMTLAGANGNDGPVGASGPSGAPGAPGPAATIETAPRETLFAGELELIRSIEATPAKH